MRTTHLLAAPLALFLVTACDTAVGDPEVESELDESELLAAADFDWYPGRLLDVGYGLDFNGEGYLWGIGLDNGIYWHPEGWYGTDWTRMPGAGHRISVSGQGNAWVIGTDNRTYGWQGGWALLPGAGFDVGGGGGATHVIGTDNGLYRWNGVDWFEPLGGWATQVATDPWGLAWVIGGGGGIHRWVGDRFQQYPGAALDIGITKSDGQVLVVGTDYQIYSLELNELGQEYWNPLGVYGYKVEGGSMRGHFFYIDGNNQLVEVREGKKKKGTAIGTCYYTGDSSKGCGVKFDGSAEGCDHAACTAAKNAACDSAPLRVKQNCTPVATAPCKYHNCF